MEFLIFFFVYVSTMSFNFESFNSENFQSQPSGNTITIKCSMSIKTGKSRYNQNTDSLNDYNV